MATATKQIYVLCGLPFSGKTTYVQELKQSLKGNCLIIERDAFLEQINREEETRERLRLMAKSILRPVSRLASMLEANAFNDALTQEYVQRVQRQIRDTEAAHIIIDGTHLQPLSRAFFDPHIEAKYVAIVLERDPTLCIARWEMTAVVGVRRTITAELIRRMAEVYERPALAEGFAHIQLV